MLRERGERVVLERPLCLRPSVAAPPVLLQVSIALNKGAQEGPECCREVKREVCAASAPNPALNPNPAPKPAPGPRIRLS